MSTGLRKWALLLLLCAPMFCQQVRLVNVIPNANSNETGRDSEPSIGVNPRNPQEIAISTFTRDPGGSADVPLFLSNNGGTGWTLSVPIVPGAASSSCIATVCDITLRFANTSNFLYVAALEGDSTTGVTTYRITRVDSTFGTPAATTLRTRTSNSNGIPDQPYIEANTVLGGAGSGNDRLFVPFNDLTVFPGMTATVDRTLNATPPPPSGFDGFVVEARSTTGQDAPPVRSAVNQSGVVYAAFTGWRTGGSEVVVVRDDNWGTGPNPFRALMDTDGNPGIRVATGLTQSVGSLGTQRVGSCLSIAVHPTDDRTVYVAYGEGSSASNWTLHVRNSTDGGAHWSADLYTITSATNPSLAVTTRGEVGFLYQRLTGTSPNQRFETHFIFSADGTFASPTDILLANAPTSAGSGYSGSNPIGDYTGMLANGKTFYGTFSANNTPDNANFHANIVYLRNANFTTHTLTNGTGGTVGVSVDPFFLAVTRTTDAQDFYVRDWSNSPTSHDNGEEPSSDPVFYANSDVWNRRSNTSGTFSATTDRPDHQDPRETTAGHNYGFVRVFRKAATAAGSSNVNVQARFLIADYGLGSNYVDAGAAAPSTLTFAPADTVKSLADGQGYEWDLPATHSDHICMAVQLENADDPPAGSLIGHAPGWPTTDLMVLNDNNKAQRNMGVWTGPPGSIDSLTFYAVIHNAAIFKRDMVLRYDIDPVVARRLRVAEITFPGAKEMQPVRLPKSGSQLVLKNMQPGEFRWVGVTLSGVGTTKGEWLPVVLTELSSGAPVNGLEVGLLASDGNSVAVENLRIHAAVFNRMAALLRMPGAKDQAAEAAKLAARKPTARQYTDFLRRAKPFFADALARIQAAAPGMPDAFDISGAITRLDTARAKPLLNPRVSPTAVLVAHTALLQKLDAFATMFDKTRGDAADVLQNVYWQRALFSRVPDKRIGNDVEVQSTQFIRAFEGHKLGTGDFPRFVARLIDALDKTASSLGDAQLRKLADTLRHGTADVEAAQKAHRDYLLRLDQLVH